MKVKLADIRNDASSLAPGSQLEPCPYCGLRALRLLHYGMWACDVCLTPCYECGKCRAKDLLRMSAGNQIEFYCETCQDESSGFRELAWQGAHSKEAELYINSLVKQADALRKMATIEVNSARSSEEQKQALVSVTQELSNRASALVRHKLRNYDRVLRLVRSWKEELNKTEVAGQDDQKKVWRGTERERAAHIVDLYDKEQIKAPSRRQAVLQESVHYVIQNRQGQKKPVKPDSLWRNYSQQTKPN